MARSGMVIDELSEHECTETMRRAHLGRIGCAKENQPYIVPIMVAYEPGYLYALSTVGQKIEWMRTNPKICVQMDEISDDRSWVSVIANGHYEELAEPRFADEREHARDLLQNKKGWWQTPFAERQAKSGDQLTDPIFFRLAIESVSGLRARQD